MRDYPINIFYREEDGGYVANIPDLASALLSARLRKKLWRRFSGPKPIAYRAAKAEGKPIPPPTFKPVIYQLPEVFT